MPSRVIRLIRGARGMVAIPLKEGMSAKEFRQAAAASSDANQARRLLSLAAIRDGMSRQAAARIGHPARTAFGFARPAKAFSEIASAKLHRSALRLDFRHACDVVERTL